VAPGGETAAVAAAATGGAAAGGGNEIIKCRDCSGDFTFEAYTTRGWPSPARCPECRLAASLRAGDDSKDAAPDSSQRPAAAVAAAASPPPPPPPQEAAPPPPAKPLSWAQRAKKNAGLRGGPAVPWLF